MSGERNWNEWIPSMALTKRSPPTWERGEIWACHTPGGHIGVFRVVEPRGDSQKNLAGDGVYFSALDSGRWSVLVQDVDQENPTPPRELYGSGNSDESDTTNWLEWLPPKNLPRQEIDLKVGMTVACRGDGASTAVYRVDKKNRHDYEITILAEYGKNAHRTCQLTNDEWWRTAVVVQDKGQSSPTSPQALYGTPNKKAKPMPENQVTGDEIEWKEHVPPAERPRGGASIDGESVKAGQVYAYWYDSEHRGVVRISRDGRGAGYLLAHTTARPTGDYDWGIQRVLERGDALLIADNNGWVSSYPKAPPHAHKRPAPQAKPKEKREVSVDGLQYVDYDKMGDSDSFESYPYYRIRKPDGTFSVDEKPVMLAPVNTQSVCVVALCSNSGPFGRAGECFSCHVKGEATIAKITAAEQVGAKVTRVREHSSVQSHSMLWGGVFSLRE